MNASEWSSFQDSEQLLQAIEQIGITNQLLKKVHCGSTAISILGLLRSEGQDAFDSLRKSGSLWYMTTMALYLASSMRSKELATSSPMATA